MRRIGYLAITVLVGMLLVASTPVVSAEASDISGEVLATEDYRLEGVWFTADMPSYRLFYQGQGYHIHNAFWNSWVASVRTWWRLADAVVEAEAAQVAGPASGYYGVVCRWQDLHNFYGFIVGDTDYGIIRVRDGAVTFLAQGVVENADSTRIIRGRCVGNVLSLEVNGEVVAEAQDDAFDAGLVGVVVLTRGEPGVEARFERFVLSRP